VGTIAGRSTRKSVATMQAKGVVRLEQLCQPVGARQTKAVRTQPMQLLLWNVQVLHLAAVLWLHAGCRKPRRLGEENPLGTPHLSEFSGVSGMA